MRRRRCDDGGEGYDFDLIREGGLEEEDLNLIGVPQDMLGLRKKLLRRLKIEEFASDDGGDDDEDGSEEEGSGEEGSEEEDA